MKSISSASKILLLAVLYIITGKIGMMLALPPGYATVIWPPSGIAIGFLIVHGWRMWPGVLFGSIILNCYISDAYSINEGLNIAKVIAAFGIAIGSTIQGLAGRWIVQKSFELPLQLRRIIDMVTLFIICGPISCLIAASIGVTTLYISGVLVGDQLASNWLTWWLGDMFGVLVFMPLVLVSPGAKSRVIWRGNAVGNLPMVAMLALVMPLGLTFYAWKITSEKVIAEQKARFESLAQESEHILMSRMESYEHALLGGVAYFQGSNNIERNQWRSYVNTINIAQNFPGINGIGYISNVANESLADYLMQVRKDNAPTFSIHPETDNKLNYIIQYVEPESSNNQALGLNIAFESNRLQAAELSRDTGKPTITKKINLVQDKQKTPGFLLLHPYYGKETQLTTIEQRQKNIQGWIYAPFIAKNFLHQLTRSQEWLLNIRVYDGTTEQADNLIYSSSSDVTNESSFVIRKQFNVMQQPWLIVWESTDAYERLERNNEPIFVMAGGLLFTGLFGLFLIMITVRREETIEWIVKEKSYMPPLIIFAITLSGTFYLYDLIKNREESTVKNVIAEQTEKIKLLIESNVKGKLQSIERMGQRWEAAEGTAETLWRRDANNYVGHLRGLKTLEWIDSTYHVRWAEPINDNKRVIGLNILFNKEREEALVGASNRGGMTITQPLDLVQGYKAFIAYSPIKIKGKFDGFIAGIFSFNELLNESINKETEHYFNVTMLYQGKPFFESKLSEKLNQDLSREGTIRIYDKTWILRLTPSKAYIQSSYTTLPELIFIAGFLIATLLSLTLRSILIGKLHAISLERSGKELRLSEEKHRLLVEGVVDYAIYWLDVNGNVDSWNKGAEKLKGYSPDEIIGKHFSIFFTKEDIVNKVPQYALNTAVKTGKYEAEGWRVRKDGSLFLAHVVLQPIHDSSGKAVGFVKVSQDVTAHRKAEQALRESEERYALVVGVLTIAIWDWNLETNKLYLSPRFKEIIGIKNDDEIGFNDFESRLHPDDKQPVLKLLQSHLKGDSSYDIEYRLKHNNGTFVWIHAKGQVEWNNQNIPIRMIGAIEDITTRKIVEDALKTSEETFRSAIENACIGMALVEPEGRWLKVNQALSDMLGYSEQELLSLDFQAITHPEDLKKDLELVRKSLADEIKNYKLEKRYYHKEGRTIWALLSVSLVRDSFGKPQYFISQIQDVTEQKEVERIKSEFISIVSHELRTPLNAVIGLSDLLTHTQLDNQQFNILTKLQLASQSLLSIINDVLDLSKIEAGQMALEDAPFDFKRMVTELVQVMAPQAEIKNIPIITTVAHDLPSLLCGDITRIRQIFINLLGNAIKFTQQGRIEVTVNWQKQGNEYAIVECVVKDSGIGISPESQSKLFSPFVQADTSTTRRFGGSGLGLSIVRNLVDLMEGKIELDSAVGAGSTFKVRLPLKIVNHTAIASSEKPLEILIAVTDDITRDTLASLCHSQQWRTELVSSGQDLVERTLERVHLQMPPKILIVDRDLPDLNGLEAFEKLSTQLSRNRLPSLIIMQEKNAESLISSDPLTHFTYTVLTKPIDPSTLVKGIHDVINERKLQVNQIEEVESKFKQLHNAHIMVVDDSELNLFVASNILQRQGAIVTTCTNGREVVDFLQLHPNDIDVVLMDVQMPDMDGNEAARQIRNTLGLTSIPIIALTAGTLISERQRSLAAGMNDVLTKPLDSKILIQTIRAQIEKFRGQLPAEKSYNKIQNDFPPDWPFIEGIDSRAAYQSFGENVSVFITSLIRVLSEFSDIAENYQMADQKILADRLHKLRGSAGTLGALSIYRLASEAENILRDDTFDGNIDRIMKELNDALMALTRHANTILLSSSKTSTTNLTGNTQSLVSEQDLTALKNFIDMLRGKDLAALEHVDTLSPSLQAILGNEVMRLLLTKIENLDFEGATHILEEHI